MPRALRKKTSDVPTRIYSYRCLPPITEVTRVEDQCRLAHQYRNALVEVDHKLRDEIYAVQFADPIVGEALWRYEEAAVAVEAIYDDLRAAKAGAADPDLTDLREELLRAKELRGIFSEELREAKVSRIQDLQPGYEAARIRAKNSRKQARHSFIAQGLRSGPRWDLLDRLTIETNGV